MSKRHESIWESFERNFMRVMQPTEPPSLKTPCPRCLRRTLWRISDSSYVPGAPPEFYEPDAMQCIHCDWIGGTDDDYLRALDTAEARRILERRERWRARLLDGRPSLRSL